MIVFLTFGTTPEYSKALKRIEREAHESKYFHTIHITTQDHPALECLKETGRSQSKYGFALWKPLLALHTFETMLEGDTLVYADAGCRIFCTDQPRSQWEWYMEQLQKSESGRLGFQQPLREEWWTKADTLDVLLLQDSRFRRSGQLMSGIWMLKKSEANISFLKTWADWIQKDGNKYVDDSPSLIPNASEFRDHRGDQSIFSCLMKQAGCFYAKAPQPDDTYPIAPYRQRNS